MKSYLKSYLKNYLGSHRSNYRSSHRQRHACRSRLGASAPLAALLAAPILALSACTVTEVSPEVGTTAGKEAGRGEANPEMAVRLPSIRLANRSLTPIDSLTQENAGSTVAVSGTIVQRSAVLDGWLYQVRDDSGSIWVLADSSTPQVSETAVIEGTVRYEPIVVGEIDASGVYIEEQSYRKAGR